MQGTAVAMKALVGLVRCAGLYTGVGRNASRSSRDDHVQGELSEGIMLVDRCGMIVGHKLVLRAANGVDHRLLFAGDIHISSSPLAAVGTV